MKRHLLFSVADQAIVSAFNFALNVYLVRTAAPEEFGLFATIIAATLFAAMVQNALVNTPLSVHLPVARDAEDRIVLRRAFTAANAFLSLILFAGSALALVFWLGAGRWAVALSACFYLVTQFVREYYRALLAIEGKFAGLFALDLSAIVLAVTALALRHLVLDEATAIVSAAFLVIGSTTLLSLVPACIASAWHGSLREVAADVRRIFREQRHEIRWSLLGVITTEVQNRGYIYIAAAVFGPIAVAHLQAGRILFGPLNLLTSAWARVARPQLAALLARSDAVEFGRVLTRALQAFSAFNIVFLAALWLAWPMLSTLVFRDKYTDLGMMVAAWGIANVLFQSRSCLGIGIQAMRRFRELTLATVAGAALALALAGVICFTGQPAWLVGPVIAGECLALLIVTRILRRPAPTPAVVAA